MVAARSNPRASTVLLLLQGRGRWSEARGLHRLPRLNALAAPRPVPDREALRPMPPAIPRGDAPRRHPLQHRDAVRSGSRCYARRADLPIAGTVDLTPPAELRSLDELHPLALPSGLWPVASVERTPDFNRQLPRTT